MTLSQSVSLYLLQSVSCLQFNSRFILVLSLCGPLSLPLSLLPPSSLSLHYHRKCVCTGHLVSLTSCTTCILHNMSSMSLSCYCGLKMRQWCHSWTEQPQENLHTQPAQPDFRRKVMNDSDWNCPYLSSFICRPFILGLNILTGQQKILRFILAMYMQRK